MKKAFSTLCCLSYDFEQILALAQAVHMDGVELRIDNAMLDAICGKTSPTTRSYAALWGQRFRDVGIAITDVAASISLTCYDEEVIHNAHKYIDLAAELGAHGVRVFAGESPKTHVDEILCDWEGVIRSLQELCDYAAPLGVEIWLETHSEFSTGRVCAKAVDEAGRPNLKVIWDVIHSLEYHETLEDSVEYLKDCLAHVHLKDGRPHEDAAVYQYIHTDLGAGTMPWAEVAAVLNNIGYDGYYSLEWESPWRPEIRDLYPDPEVLLKKYTQILEAL